MSFYSAIKTEFGEEPYLQLESRLHRANIAKIRSSSHDLRIETGRYDAGKTSSVKSLKACRFCHDVDSLSILEVLPFFEDPTPESEEHALTECPGYHHLRLRLSDNLKSLIMLKAYKSIMSSLHLKEFGQYLTDCSRLRTHLTN